MNRRSFLKFLGIGSAAAVVAPSIALAEIDKPAVPEPVVSWTTDEFTWEPLGYIAQGRYMYVKVPKTSMPFQVGDYVYHKRLHYKYRGRRESTVIAYKTKKLRAEPLAIAMSAIAPGYYGLVQVVSQAGDFAAKEFNPETGCYPLNHFNSNCFEEKACLTRS